MAMKLNGGTFLLRIELERERGLTNAEWRLWLVYRSLCAWDRTRADFGIADITIVGLQKYLDWSTGSICSTRKSLVTKGKLQKIQGSKYKLVDAENILRPRFRQAEVGVRRIEGAVQYVEGKRMMGGFPKELKSVEFPDFSEHKFQPVEVNNVPKETIKKDKEANTGEIPFKEEEGMGEERPIWHDLERVRRFKESIKRRGGSKTSI